jgi:hypothetical protein
VSTQLSPSEISSLASSIADGIRIDVEGEIESALYGAIVENNDESRRQGMLDLLDEMDREGITDECSGTSPVDEFARRKRREMRRA